MARPGALRGGIFPASRLADAMFRLLLAGRLAAVAALLLTAAGCDTSTDRAGAFSAVLSGAQERTVAGGAQFERGYPCRVLEMRGQGTQFSMSAACASGGPDVFRTGRIAVAPRSATDSTLFVSFYDEEMRRAYHSTGGFVEVVSESPERIAGRFDIEARRLRVDNQIDTTGTPLRVVGTFEAEAVTLAID